MGYMALWSIPIDLVFCHILPLKLKNLRMLDEKRGRWDILDLLQSPAAT